MSTSGSTVGVMPGQTSVDWFSLRDAFDDAAAVPSLLKQLVSTDSADREAAIDELWSRLCHQETVYSASAAAIPSLVEAATSGALAPIQRVRVLRLVVYIGRGEDTCWKGYSSSEEVEACRAAVAAFVPELVRWAEHEDSAAQAAALQLGVYHRDEFIASGVDPASVLADVLDEAAAAGASLARAMITREQLDAAAVRAAAQDDPDTLDYLDAALDHEPIDRQARGVALELLNRVMP